VKLLNRFPVLKYRLILQGWKLDKIQRWFSCSPLTRGWINLDEKPENNEAVILPVQEAIQGAESVALPYQLLTPLVEQASGHLVLGKCPCRNAENCHTAPHDFGCLYLGEAVEKVSPKIGQHTDAQGALAHVRQGLELGLVPMIVHASFDAEMLSLPYNKMLAVCFCCDCCCTVRHHLRLGPSTFDETVHRLPGLTVMISEDCEGCGDCQGKCPVGAIAFQDGRSVIDQVRCKGCGVCAEVCPVGAVQLMMDESVDVMGRLVERIRQRTDIGV
jgi:UDP-glucose 4-epimerase